MLSSPLRQYCTVQKEKLPEEKDDIEKTEDDGDSDIEDDEEEEEEEKVTQKVKSFTIDSGMKLNSSLLIQVNE